MNIASLVSVHARKTPSKAAIEAGTDVITYEHFDRRIRQLASRLRTAGVEAGDVVAVWMRDTPMHIAAIFAAARVGAVLLPLDARWTLPEIARNTDRFKPKAILTDNERRIAAITNVVGTGDLDSTAPDSHPPVELADQPMVYALTSGTTGEPKAMILTHEDMHGRFVTGWTEYPLLESDRFLNALPLAYGAARVHVLGLLCLGATVVMIPTISEPIEVVHVVNERRVSALMLPPNVTRALLAMVKDRPVDRLFPNLRLYLSATASIRPDERAAVSGLVCPNLIDIYASTGGGPAVLLTPEITATAPDSAGRPVKGIEVEVVDEHGQARPAGEIGWVRLRGRGVTRQFASADATGDEGLRDGWYYPGDLGSFDARGLLYLHGRTADLIKRGGLMVYSQEVERVLASHPACQEAAVAGIPSPTLGEEVAAFVITSAPVTPAELLVHCRRHLASHKIPKHITILDTFPRNANGKVVKSQLIGLIQT